jgi:hypothetical protein
MRVSICTTLFNPLGDVLLNASETSDFNFLSRRLTRTATLDGGSVIVDNGFSASDGTIKVIVDPNNNGSDSYAKVANIIKQFGLVTVSNPDGVFLAAIDGVTNAKTTLVISLLIKSQLV